MLYRSAYKEFVYWSMRKFAKKSLINTVLHRSAYKEIVRCHGMADQYLKKLKTEKKISFHHFNYFHYFTLLCQDYILYCSRTSWGNLDGGDCLAQYKTPRRSKILFGTFFLKEHRDNVDFSQIRGGFKNPRHWIFPWKGYPLQATLYSSFSCSGIRVKSEWWKDRKARRPRRNKHVYSRQIIFASADLFNITFNEKAVLTERKVIFDPPPP